MLSCVAERVPALADLLTPGSGVQRRMVEQDRKLEELESKLLAQGKAMEAMSAEARKMQSKMAALVQQAGAMASVSSEAAVTMASLDLRGTFSAFDRDGSGSIDVSELQAALRKLGMSAMTPQAVTVIRRYDDSADGVIDFGEFQELVHDIQLLVTYDKDGSGSLDINELFPALRELGLEVKPRHAKLILRAWDADNSGQLDLLEFASLVKSMKTFRIYDCDQSGTIDVGELRNALRKLGLPTTDDIAASLIAR